MISSVDGELVVEMEGLVGMVVVVEVDKAEIEVGARGAVDCLVRD